MIQLSLANRLVKSQLPALVMGILNVTPDSFYEKSRAGLEKARTLIEEGADILDIGGESSRPGSDYVSAEEEIKRVIPLVKEIRRFSDIPISIDTRKFSVMQAAYEEGADILNDISALEDDEKLPDFCGQKKIPVILMHKRGIPSQMQKNTVYSQDIFTEVNSYLQKRVDFALKAGISSDKIWIDPGIGFGKNQEDNFTLIKKCGQLLDGKYPVLMALSRKSCLGNLCGRDVNDRLAATLTADILSVQRGASIIRVHDVAEAVDSLKVLKSVENF